MSSSSGGAGRWPRRAKTKPKTNNSSGEPSSANDRAPRSTKGNNITTKTTASVNESKSAKCVLLALPSDSQWLSPQLCVLKEQIEVFQATKEDLAERRTGPRPPLGAVGFRCRHCVHVPFKDRARGAVVYPKSLSLIHQTMRNFQRYHVFQCTAIPESVRDRLASFKPKRSQSTKGSATYWTESSNEQLGMMDVAAEGDTRGGSSSIAHIRFRDDFQPPVDNGSAVAAAMDPNDEDEDFDNKVGASVGATNNSSPAGGDGTAAPMAVGTFACGGDHVQYPVSPGPNCVSASAVAEADLKLFLPSMYDGFDIDINL